MKIKKILPVLLALPCLTGCNTSTMKAPKFKAYSNEVTYDTFLEAWNIAYNNSVVEKEDLLSSNIIKLNNYDLLQTKTSLKASGLTFANKSELFESLTEKNDTNNLLSDTKTDIKMVLKGDEYTTGSHHTSDAVGKANGHTFLQVETVNEQKMIVMLNVDIKSYKKFAVINDGETEASVFDSGIRSEIDQYTFNAFKNHINNESNYKYFLDEENSLFTVVYENEIKNDIEGQDDVLTTSKIAQIKISEKEITFKLNNTQIETTEYLESTTSTEYAAGDVIETQKIAYADVKVQFTNVNLKKLDISKYNFIND